MRQFINYNFLSVLLLPYVIFNVSNSSAQEKYNITSNILQYDTLSVIQILGKAKSEQETKKAILYYQNARVQSEQLHYAYGIVKSLNGIGVIYLYEGNYPTATEYFTEAARYVINTNKHLELLPGIYSNIANNFSNSGQFDSALFYSFKALNLATHSTANTSLSVSALHNNISNVYSYLNQYDKTVYHAEMAIQYAVKERDTFLECAAYLTLSSALGNLPDKNGHEERVEAYLKKVVDLARKHHWAYLKHKAFVGLGNLYKTKEPSTSENIEKALYYFQQAQTIPVASNSDRITTNISIGDCLALLKRYKQAEAILLESLEQSKALDLHYIPTLAMIARLYSDQGKYKQANSYYSQYIALTEQKETSKEKALKVQYLYEAKEKENAAIKKELALNKQDLAIQRKSTIASLVFAFAISIVVIIIFYFRYRRKLDKQKIETASWKATLEGEERERKRLAKELHDNIGGNLSTIKMWLANMQSRTDTGTVLKQDVEDVEKLVGQTLTEVRNTAHHLMPELLLRLGLTEAVRIYCINAQKATGIDFEFHYLGYIGNLGKGLELMLYRIIQELVQNIVKHSSATSALVQMSLHVTKLTITVEDNGKGIEPADPQEYKGIGLQSVQTTIEHLGGQFSISSEPGSGTTVEIELNTENSFADKSILI